MSARVLLEARPCTGCKRHVVRGEDGVWRHPGGSVVMWTCANRCVTAGSGTIECPRCGGRTLYQDHDARPDLSTPVDEPEVVRPGIGSEVYGRRTTGGDAANPAGGVVLGIDDEPNDDNKVVRSYICVSHYVDPLHGRLVTIRRVPEAEVDPETVVPHSSLLSQVLRALVADLSIATSVSAMRDKHYKRAFEDIALLHRLMGVQSGAA